MTQKTAASTVASPKLNQEVLIEIRKMSKWYGQFQVLKDIDFSVYTGERVVICGPSGSGSLH